MKYMFALESLYILDEPAEYTATYEELLEQASALESFADTLEDELFVYSAMEAMSDDADLSPSQISAKYRSGFDKVKKGKRSKNQAMILEGQKEIAEASNDLKEAEKNANTPEKKNRLNAVAKIAIAIGGAALLSLLAYVGIKNKDKIVELIKKLKKNPGTSIAQTVSEVNSAANTAVSTPIEDNPVSVNGDNSKPAPTASIKPKEKTELQITADKIRADRAHKKELKDWYVQSQYKTDQKDPQRVTRGGKELGRRLIKNQLEIKGPQTSQISDDVEDKYYELARKYSKKMTDILRKNNIDRHVLPNPSSADNYADKLSGADREEFTKLLNNLNIARSRFKHY